jgi:carboxyl-terminal processing protease
MSSGGGERRAGLDKLAAMRRPWRIVAIVGFTVSILLGGVVGSRLLALTDEARESLRLYTELVNVAQERYGREVPYRDLVYASIHGMLRALDPHTSFLPPEAYDSMRERQQSSFYGLGILVGMRNGLLTVISPIDGTPASRLGIRAGDVIETIEGDPTEEMTLDDAVQRLKGPKGTEVRITIVRPALDDPLELTITRAEIPQTTVRYAYMIDPETGYILISDFARSTGDEVARALETLKQKGMRRLLVDLRNNGGGLLDQAIEVADQFVPKGTKIVETRGRTRDAFQEYSAAGEHTDLALPVVVLVNGGTASAAEILAGAIQDHDVGMIAGTPTWGKGLVQTVYPLPYGAGLALTTAKYYTPSGRLIQRDYSSFFDYLYTDRDGEAASPPAAAQQFATDLGRKVYGGGGITPDVVTQPFDVPPYLQYLYARNAFFDFAVQAQAKRPLPSRDWRPDPELLSEFRQWLAARSLGTPEEQAAAFADPEIREFAQRQIHAELLNSAFGLEAGHKVLTGNDRQLQTALGLFSRAAELLDARKELKQARAQRAATTAVN